MTSTNTTQDPQWYEFSSHNSQSLFGFGTEKEATQYCEHLNEGRDINVYAASPAEGEDSDYCNTWANLEDALAELS